MKISRRDFLKWSVAAAAALKLDLDFDGINTVLAADTNPPVIWLQGAGCTGCSISTLNVTTPTTIDDVLLNKISMKYNSTLMASSGDLAMQTLDQTATQYKGQFVLVIEGAIPTGANGNYCIMGESSGTTLTMQAAVLKYGPMAKYVVSAGTCSSFGGVPAAAPNTTSCTSVKTILSGKTANPVINLPSCPVHPTVLIQILIDLFVSGQPALDTYNRPTKYYSKKIHKSCPRRETSEVRQPGVYGCYEAIGCQGKSCFSNICPSTKWNDGKNWCINSNYPCIGCANPTFPTNPLLGSGEDD